MREGERGGGREGGEREGDREGEKEGERDRDREMAVREGERDRERYTHKHGEAIKLRTKPIMPIFQYEDRLTNLADERFRSSCVISSRRRPPKITIGNLRNAHRN